MVRIIGDVIEFEGTPVARLIPGTAWPSLVTEFIDWIEGEPYPASLADPFEVIDYLLQVIKGLSE